MVPLTYDGAAHIRWCRSHTMVPLTYDGAAHIRWCRSHISAGERARSLLGRWSRRLVGNRPTIPRSSNDMHALKTAIDIAWIIFWVYWLASAFGVKEGRASRRRIPLNGLTALSVVLLAPRLPRREPGRPQPGPRSDRGSRVRFRDRAGDLGSRPSWAQLGDADDPEGRAGARYLRPLPIRPPPDLLGTAGRSCSGPRS